MKIIQIISSLGNGGAEKFLVELSNELIKNNNDVTIISFKDLKDDMIFLKNINSKNKLITLNKKNGFSLILYFQLIKQIIYEKPNTIHFHLDSTFKYIFPLTFIFQKKQFIYTIHSKFSNNNSKKFKKINKLFFWKKNIKYVCISESIKNDFNEHFKKLNFHKIENGIKELAKIDTNEHIQNELNQLKYNNETRIAIVVGKVVPVKNYKLLIESFNKLKNENIICIVIGNTTSISIDYFNEINKKNSGNVHFLGLKSNVNDYLNLSDVFLMTSLNEGLPISALEALSIGKPIITTPAGGMVDLIQEKENGFITSGFESDEYSETILKYLNIDNKEVENIKNNNHNKFINNYTIAISCKSYYNLYTSKI